VLSDPSIDNIFGFSGYMYNPSTKLYCLRLRWYSTDLGRFIQRDPALVPTPVPAAVNIEADGSQKT
jgi:RHS repeat-associated protein